MKSKLVKPSWIKLSAEELEKIVIDLAKKGESPAKIGLILRDQHGVPKAKLLGKKITQILKENNIEYTDKKKIFETKVEKLKKHLEKNKHDYPAQRSLTKKLWVLYNLKRKGK